MSDNFKNKKPISPNEFDGGGTDDVNEIESMRSLLQSGVQITNQSNVSNEPPPPVKLSGNVPPQVYQSMKQPQFSNHPLNQQNFSSNEEFDPMSENMTEAQAMYYNAKKLMNQQKNTSPEQNFTPNQMVQRTKYDQFKDPQFEKIIDQLTGVKFEEIELPSRGKFYFQGEGPSDGIIHIRPMTGAEEQILTTPRLVKKNLSLNMIFKECIGEQINPELLLSEDRTYILIYLRGISYSTSYDVEIKCPSCDKSSQQKIPLDLLEVNYCPDDFDIQSLEDTLPSSGLKVRYRLSTGRDEILVQEHKDKRIKDWGADVTDDSNLFRMSLLVEEIEGITNKTMIQQIVARLPIGDMAYLRELINNPPFGVNTKIGIACPHCLNDFELEMPMELGFFFPKPNLQRKKQQQV